MSRKGSCDRSLEDAIEGNYHFDVAETFSEAWQRTYGCKWTFQMAYFYYALVVLAFLVAIYFLPFLFGYNDDRLAQNPAIKLTVGFWTYSLLKQLAPTLFLTPLTVGVLMMGIWRSIDRELSATMVFSAYIKLLPLFFTTVLMYIMVGFGLVLLIIPGIYLFIAYMFALPLVMERGLDPWVAMEVSRKAVSKRWFSLLCFYLAQGLVLFVSAIPLGLGLIWTLPMVVIANGIAYRNIFGCDESLPT